MNAMNENVITAPPEITNEIAAAIAVFKKNGYRVTSEETPSGDLLLNFRFGENEQTLKFSSDEWRKPGIVEKRIVDKLEI